MGVLGAVLIIMNRLDCVQMQEFSGGRKFNADCAFALAGLGIATAGLVIAMGPFAAGAAAFATGDAIGFFAAFFGSGFAAKDVFLGCF